jgi:hypothetical protein
MYVRYLKMSVQKQPGGECQESQSRVNVLVVGDITQYPEEYGVLRERVLDVEAAHFLLPDDDPLSDAVLEFAASDSNPHTAARMNAPPTPGLALPFAEKALILEDMKTRGDDQVERYRDWVEKATQLLGKGNVFAAVCSGY